jgi:hypothetical protein
MKEDEIGMACSTNGNKRNAYRIVMGKPEKRARERPRGRLKLRWEDNIKMGLIEIGWGGT